LAGCTVGPDYREPEIMAPSRWQAARAGAPGLRPVDPERLKGWWKNFGDTGLNRLMDRAIGGNRDLKTALARIDQARAERRANQAALFPSVDLSAGVQRAENPFPGLRSGLRYNLFELGFDALWEIDLFGRQSRRLEAASADLEGSAQAYRQALVTLTADVARNYTEYRSLQNQLEIARSNLNSQRRTLTLTEKIYSEGVGTRHDVVRARAQVETTEAQIPQLEGALSAMLRQLEALTGQWPGSLARELAGPGPIPRAPGPLLLASPAETIRHRPDLRMAERRLAAATALQGAAVAELFPKISIAAFLGLRNTDLESLFRSAAFSWSTGANLLQPLLNFGRIRAGIDLADARQKEAYLAYEKAILDALSETESALSRYLKEDLRRQSLDKSVADLNEAVRLSELRYREGVTSFLDVLDAQRVLYASEMDLVRSKAAVATYLIATYKALGGGAGPPLPPQPRDDAVGQEQSSG
jgi:NodT family efflux transporter outer membrane factor (OMF) lipoprotein